MSTYMHLRSLRHRSARGPTTTTTGQMDRVHVQEHWVRLEPSKHDPLRADAERAAAAMAEPTPTFVPTSNSGCAWEMAYGTPDEQMWRAVDHALAEWRISQRQAPSVEKGEKKERVEEGVCQSALMWAIRRTRREMTKQGQVPVSAGDPTLSAPVPATPPQVSS